MTMRFRAIIELAGKTATGIQVPSQVVERLGAGQRPRVSVTINGYTYRSTVAPMGGVYMLPVSAEVRKGAGAVAGDEVDVDVELDTAPREVDVPADLAAALESNAEAKRFFEGLSYSNKRRIVLSVEAAKTAETRARRIAKVANELQQEQV